MRPRAPTAALPRLAALLALGLTVTPAFPFTLAGCRHAPREQGNAVTAASDRAAQDEAASGDTKGVGGMPRGYAPPVPLASRAVDDGSDAGAGTSSNGLANPGPTSNPCTRDDECITHRCNPAFHRCAFPCVSDRDCTAGNYCYTSVVAVCLPRSEGASVAGDAGAPPQ
jgi:hypothetical protein